MAVVFDSVAAVSPFCLKILVEIDQICDFEFDSTAPIVLTVGAARAAEDTH